MTRTRTSVLTATFFLLSGALALLLVLMTGKSSGSVPALGGKMVTGGTETEGAGEGPRTGYEAYLAAMRTYPANVIPPAIVAREKATFNRIVRRDARLAKRGKHFADAGPTWSFYGPRRYGIQPGVLAFTGATNTTASRTTALIVSPDCGRHGGCRVWAGVAGGGVWRTNNALGTVPEWHQVAPAELAQNSVGTLTLSGKTLYLGTGEANRCSSGCEAGVGIYKSTDGGNHWKKLADSCVSNTTFACAAPGVDAFLGRGIRAIVIDPRDPKHIIVGSALGIRGMSHTVGINPGESQRFEPGANEPGLYESTDGGQTFTEVWDGTKPDGGLSFGITDVALDPLDPGTVYAGAFDAGLWRRNSGAAATAFQQVFAPQFIPPACTPTTLNGCALAGTDRTMIAPTVKNGHTRIYLTEGTANAEGPLSATAAAFWRTDNANQPAATLLASQAAGATVPPGNGNPFPATYAGWQRLTSTSTASPYFATDDFCTGQCWYDQKVYTPKGRPNTVYVLGSFQYGEVPCNTKGVGCGNGRSNGRGVLYSATAGDPDPNHDNRTFTDLTYDSQNTFAPWCAFAKWPDLFAVGMGDCVRAPNGIHPDQQAIGINPSNPNQIFEGSDGGVIRTSGAFADISAQCSERGRAGNLTANSQHQCMRLLSHVPTLVSHINKRLSSTLQFIGVAINPARSCEVMAGTQDNGTWSNNNGCDLQRWPQIIYGDGGNSGYDATNARWRFNEFTSAQTDSNFRNGDPEKWVITGGPLTNSGEFVGFYWPQVADPNPVRGTHPIYSGLQHVWRSWAFGAGEQGEVPQDKIPHVADYEANCPEFVTFSTEPTCGDFRPLGGPFCDGLATTPTIPSCANQPGDLTGTAYGTDRTGGGVSWIARDREDHGTIWVATSAGRIFVTHNGDAVDPATVTWHRIDNPSSPSRFPSSIYPDPTNDGHAWVTYSGYNAATPTTPGHVFEVHENGTAPGSGTFTNLNVESGAASAFPTPTADGDLPVNDVVRDDLAHTLYVATDFGVLRGPNDGHAGWHVTAGMPRYEVTHLEIEPSSRVPTCVGTTHCKRLIYAATHSRGIWVARLGSG